MLCTEFRQSRMKRIRQRRTISDKLALLDSSGHLAQSAEFIYDKEQIQAEIEDLLVEMTLANDNAGVEVLECLGRIPRIVLVRL